MFKNSHHPLLPTQFLSLSSLQHAERSPLVPAVTSLSGALLLPQLSSAKDGGAIPSGRTPPPRAGWEGRLGRQSQGEARLTLQGCLSSPAGGCFWKPHCGDQKRFLACICVPYCSLWLFKSPSQTTYPSLGDFEPVFISEH